MLNLNLVCDDASSGWLGLFDFSIAPNLMFFSYIPIVILSLFFSIFVYRKNKNTLSKLLLLITILFSIWAILEIITWVAIPVVLVAFSWQMLFLITPTIFLLSFFFFYNFIFGRNPNFKRTFIILTAFFPVLLLLPSRLNFLNFDIYNCENVDGIAWIYGYFFDLLAMFMILVFGLIAILFSKKDRIKNLLITIATLMFLGILFVSTTFADITSLYEFNLLGPIGMLAFVVLMSYLITKYNIFNMKVLTARFLVFALIFGVFSLLFVNDIQNVKYISLAILIFTIVIGYLLVKSVKIIEFQKNQLMAANKNQQNLLHFITHQIKGFLTKSRNIFDGILIGDYGDSNVEIKDAVKHGFESDTKGVEMIQSILHAANLKKGTVSFNKEKIDLTELVLSLIKNTENKIKEKGLRVVENIAKKPIFIDGDILKLKEVFKNILENSIIYTQKGFIEISLHQKNDTVVFRVKDSGVGLSKEDKKYLFTEGGVGKKSLEYNIDTTGYGLFIAKQIVKEHYGKIWAESEGEGEGSVFTIELPAKS